MDSEKATIRQKIDEILCNYKDTLTVRQSEKIGESMQISDEFIQGIEDDEFPYFLEDHFDELQDEALENLRETDSTVLELLKMNLLGIRDLIENKARESASIELGKAENIEGAVNIYLNKKFQVKYRDVCHEIGDIITVLTERGED